MKDLNIDSILETLEEIHSLAVDADNRLESLEAQQSNLMAAVDDIRKHLLITETAKRLKKEKNDD